MSKNRNKKNKKVNSIPQEKKINDMTAYGELLRLNTMFTQAPLINSTKHSLITLNWQELTYAYVNFGLVQRFIDQPILDALRGGINIISQELGDKVKEIDIYMKDKGIYDAFIDACKWKRLYGGGGLIINTSGKPDQPLDIDKIPRGAELELYDADLWELNYQFDANSINEFQNQNDTGTVKYCYYGNNLNDQRVIRLTGKRAPALVRRQLRGWGMSELERLLMSINQYMKNQQCIFEGLDEFKLDVYKFTGFNEALATAKEDEIAKKVREVNDNKNFQNAVVLDKEDDYVTKQITFSGLAEMVREIRIGVACDLNMPVTKLFGISSAGFNSGDDDIENYNAMIESEIRQPLRTPLLKVIKLICKILFGFVPEDIDFEYKPLRILSGEQEEKVKSRKLERILNSLARGVIDVNDACKIINNGNVLDIQIPEITELHKTEIQELDEAGKDIPLRGTTDFGN